MTSPDCFLETADADGQHHDNEKDEIERFGPKMLQNQPLSG